MINKILFCFGISVVGVFLTVSFCGAFENPPYLTVAKPTPNRTFIIDAAGNGDYSNFTSAENNAQPGDIFKVKAGNYPHFTWGKSGVQGNEIVVEAFGDGPAVIMGAAANEVPARLSGSWLIFDGGPNKQLIFDGSNNDISHSKSVLYLSGYNITVSSVEVKNNGSSEGETILKGGNNKIYNSIYHGSEGEGIYVRDGSNFEIKNNIFYANKSGGLQFNPHTTGEDVYNVILDSNVFYGNGFGAIDGDRGGIQIFIGASGHTLSGVLITNNLIFNNNLWGIKIDQSGGATISDVNIFNNTIYNNGSYGIWTKLSNIGSIKNNVICDNNDGSQLWQASATNAGSFKDFTNNLITSPGFFSTISSDSNFLKLDSTSASAINQGLNLSAYLTKDFFGSTRGANAFDIGAHEYSTGGPHIPVANAGPDQTVVESVTVTLDGSNSSDADNDIATYEWLQLSGTSVPLSSPNIAQPTFTAPAAGVGGTALTFELTVTDDTGFQSIDSCIVNVTDSNTPPTADAGTNQIVNEGESVALNGSGSSDADGSVSSYKWTQISGTPVALSSSNAIRPTFTAPDVGPNGVSLTFQITVTDDGGLQATDTCVVTVTWINVGPTADAGSDQTVDEGTTVILDSSGSSDTDDGIATYRWTQTAGTPVTLSDAATALPTFVAPAINANQVSLTFQMTVEDNGGLKDTDQVNIMVNDNGISAFPVDVIGFTLLTNDDIGLRVDSGGNIVSLTNVSAGAIADNRNRPRNLIYGLLDYKIKVHNAGDTATVTIFLPRPAPEGYSWYKYDSSSGWYDYSGNVSFNATRDKITLTLVDGGIGDEDGFANGIIVDPSGLASGSISSSSASSSGGGGGCFISIAAYDAPGSGGIKSTNDSTH